MVTPAVNDNDRLAHSLVDWWQLAGVQWDYAETPTDWLADDPPVSERTAGAAASATPPTQQQQQRAAPVAVAAEPPKPPLAELVLPADLATFGEAWRNGALGADGGHGPYIAPSGNSRPKVMVMTGAPEEDDLETVLSGTVGTLISNICAAACFAPDTVYRASFFPRVVLDGRAAAEYVDHWRRIALHHIALVEPETLVVAGAETARALLGHDPSQKPPVLHFLNHGGRTVKTVVMRKPGLMLHRIAQEKAMAWQSWQLLLTE